MSADEIRKLAESSALESVCGFDIDNDCCGNVCDDDEIRECQQRKDIRAALLAYAAMVERCEKRRYEIMDLIDYILRGDAGKEEK